MGLHRHTNCYDETLWEVDESGLSVFRSSQTAPKRPGGKQGPYRVGVIGSPSGRDFEFLRRHALDSKRFPSRARAVDALRLALAVEPRHAQPQTRWTRVGARTYHSRDGHWRARKVGRAGTRFTPLSREASEALERHNRGRESSGLGNISLLDPSLTLRASAFRADSLNQDLGL